MFGHSWRIGRFAGIEVRVDASWTVIALLVLWGFFALFEAEFPELAVGAAAVLALVTTLLFFGSVLVHELAHSVLAQARGVPVKGITLFLFGGATHARLETQDPKDELLIAGVGPLTSAALAGLLWVIVTVGDPVLSTAVAYALRRLAFINLALAIFNLAPGLPLDGGRVLRALLWQATGNLRRATRIASQGGQFLGYLLIAVGVAAAFLGWLGGLWFAAIGWFLTQAAMASYQQVQVRSVLAGVEAQEVMSPGLVAIPAGLTIQEAVDGYFMRYDHSAFPVVVEERSVGLLTLRAVRQLARAEWGEHTVAEVMGSLDESCTVAAEDPMNQVLEKLEDEEAQRVLVRRGDEVVGIITPRDVARWLRRSQELGRSQLRS